MIRCRSLPSMSLLLGLLLSTGCQDSGPRDTGFTVRDSAGIQMVESAAPAWEPGVGWTLAAEPSLEIGLLDGPEEYVFDRIGEVFLLSDGRIAASNRRTSEIRYFASDGTFLNAVGGAGEGPGEFQSMRTWPGTADTLLVYDSRLARVTTLDPEGGFVTSIRIEGESGLGFPTPFGSTSDGGSFVTNGTGGYGAGASGLLQGNEIIFSRHSPEGEFRNVIARFQAGPQWAYTSGGRTGATYLPYSVGWTVYAWEPEHVFLGLGVEPEIEVRDPDGSMVRLIRWEAERRSVGDQEIAEYREESLAYFEDPNEKRYWEGWLKEVPFPDVLPTFDGLLVDRTGHLWVEQYQPFWKESHTWSILSPDGEWLGDMETPSALRITEIGADYILGVWKDEMDVEFVRMYALDRGL